MKLFINALNFYINSSMHVAFAVLALSGITMHYFNIAANPDLLFFIFFSTITGYNLVKYAEVAGFKHISLPKHLRLIQVFSFFCFVGMIFFAFRQPVEVLITVCILALFNFLYALPFISQTNLRNIAGIKIFIIAFVWAGTTVLLPVISEQFLFYDVIIAFLQRFLFVLVLMLPFEIRDLKYDKPELGTIPHILGIKNTRYTGLFLLFFILILEILKSNSTHTLGLILFLVCAVCLIFVMRARIDQGTYYSSFWVEGIPVFWWMLVLVIG